MNSCAFDNTISNKNACFINVAILSIAFSRSNCCLLLPRNMLPVIHVRGGNNSMAADGIYNPVEVSRTFLSRTFQNE